MKKKVLKSTRDFFNYKAACAFAVRENPKESWRAPAYVCVCACVSVAIDVRH